MTNTQTKVARLTARVERIEAALREIAEVADPYLQPEAPAFRAAYGRLRALVAHMPSVPGKEAIDLTKLTPEQQRAAFAKGFGL